MSDFSIYVPELLRLLRLVYADWNDFSHTLFVQDEIEYKRAASSFAREQLSREALAALLDAADYDGFLARLNSVARKTNLLYMGTPREGDLALIKRGGIDPAPICRAVFDLLHGDGDAADRLDVFSSFLNAGDHPQRWPFATYYLFLLHPEREVFVKPSVTKWLSKFTDGAIPYKQRPSGRTYAAIRDGFHALRDALERAIAPTLPQSLLPGSQPELGTRHPRPDMIDVQSVVYVAHQAGTKDQSHLSISDPNRLAPPFDAIFADAVERLRGGLPALAATSDLADIQRGRDEVYARFSPLFSPAHLPDLTAEEFASFLDFKNNHHWSGIDQYVALVTSDMPALREALAGLLKKDPLAEAYDDARHIKGLGKARITAFLHVARPEQYGVWNGKSEEGLRELGIFPALAAKATEGEQYVAINDVLLRLAEALGIDLWTLDTLWEWLGDSDPNANRLAPPFDAIFAGRAQAEWAFDLFADAVERLGGGPDDEQFALTLPSGDMMRLNIGNSMVIDIAGRGKTLHLTALIDEMEGVYNFQRSNNFRVTVKGTNRQFAVYTIPPEVVHEWPAALQAIFERSMAAFGKEFANWGRSNLRRAHHEQVFEALFDEDKRNSVLTNGLALNFAEVEKPMPPQGPPIANKFRGFTADAFAFLSELATNNNKAWMEANRDRWKSSVLEPMRALFTDLGPRVKELFDPYLQPDELEITPTAHKVLARIYKNWAATPDSMYHEYFWGAFYRQGLSRQTDVQLFITLFSYQMRFGLFIGRSAPTIRALFRDRVLLDPEGFYGLLERLGVTDSMQHGWSFETGEREVISVHSADDLHKWIGSGDYDLLRVLPPDQVVAQGPELADTIFDTFRRVFPIYLWAVAGEPEPLIERYLAAEFPADDEDDDDPPPPPYTFADFTGNTYLTGGRAAELRDMLMDKRQAIFYGPPGTGKTFVARHLGRLLTGLADPPPDRLTVVQFHPAYGYEEFIEGIRPHSEKGDDGRAVIDYPVRPGAFVRFCRVAAQYGDQPCVFIIDEINRGNIPRIFGELMLLLEYRNQSVPLPYSGERFRIPRNVHVIGTMNTADRSIALVDFALRRRFHFARFTADPDLFDRWLEGRPAPSWLGALYRRLTDEAIDDAAYRIGPSVFMRDNLTEDGVRRAWEWSVLPWLREYYFDQPARAGSWAWDGELLRGIRGEHGG